MSLIATLYSNKVGWNFKTQNTSKYTLNTSVQHTKEFKLILHKTINKVNSLVCIREYRKCLLYVCAVLFPEISMELWEEISNNLCTENACMENESYFVPNAFWLKALRRFLVAMKLSKWWNESGNKYTGYMSPCIMYSCGDK